MSKYSRNDRDIVVENLWQRLIRFSREKGILIDEYLFAHGISFFQLPSSPCRVKAIDCLFPVGRLVIVIEETGTKPPVDTPLQLPSPRHLSLFAFLRIFYAHLSFMIDSSLILPHLPERRKESFCRRIPSGVRNQEPGARRTINLLSRGGVHPQSRLGRSQSSGTWFIGPLLRRLLPLFARLLSCAQGEKVF